MNGKHARWIRSTKESELSTHHKHGASQASLVALFLCFFKNILKFSFLDGPRPWRPGPQLSAGTYFSGLTRINESQHLDLHSVSGARYGSGAPGPRTHAPDRDAGQTE